MTDVGERLDRAPTTFDVLTEEQLLDAVERVISWVWEAKGDVDNSTYRTAIRDSLGLVRGLPTRISERY